jgi:type II secretory pathway component PulC
MLAVLVIGALLANWTWVLLAPNSASVLPAVEPVPDLQTGHLFGIAAASGSVSQAVLPNVRLVGVFAGTPGFAVLELDGKRQVGLSTGREIIAGAKLVEVAIDHVVIERGGVRQQIQLSGKDSAIKSAVSSIGVAIPDMSVKADMAK